MIFVILTFIPVLILAVLANLGQFNAWARWLTNLSLLALTLFVVLAGVGARFLPDAANTDLLALGANADLPAFGGWLIATGLAALVYVLIIIGVTLARRDPHIGVLYWARPVQATALVLSVLYTGFNLASAALLTDPQALLGEASVGIGEFVAQTAGFVALALVGVGLGIRRNWGDMMGRLKLGRVGARHILPIIAVTLGMITLSAVIGGLIAFISPESLEGADAFNQLLLGAFATPLGALLLGLLTGVGEELLYRGALQPAFGWIFTSLIFALHHIQYIGPALILIFALGMVLGWVRNRWNTTTAALVHASYNATLVLISLAAGDLLAR